MPLYEYTCQKCGAKFEKLVRSMSGKEKVECPECKSARTARSISVFAAVSSGEPTGKSSVPPGSGCGRCGGPGPCAFE